MTIAVQQIIGDRAGSTFRGQGVAGHSPRGKGGRDPDLHASPPARSASGGFERELGLRPSILLYHVMRAAAAIIIRMPNKLISTCIQTAPEISTMAKWPAKARNTPKQKISSECCPHRIAGYSAQELSVGQVRGTN